MVKNKSFNRVTAFLLVLMMVASIVMVDSTIVTHAENICPKPVVLNVGAYYIELEPIEGAEYSIDEGDSWYSNPKFQGLNHSTEYSIIARIPNPDESGTYLISEPTLVTTGEQICPVPELKSATPSTLELEEVTDAEYSIDNGTTWQESPIFTGLRPNTTYSLILRVKDTNDLTKWIVSSGLSVTTPECTNHIDEDEDGLCDMCGYKIKDVDFGYTLYYTYDNSSDRTYGIGRIHTKLPFTTEPTKTFQGKSYLLDSYEATYLITSVPTNNVANVHYVSDLNGDGIPDKNQDPNFQYKDKYPYRVEYLYGSDENKEVITGSAPIGTKIPFVSREQMRYKTKSWELTGISVKSLTVSPDEEKNVIILTYTENAKLNLTCEHEETVYQPVEGTENHNLFCEICKEVVKTEQHIDEDKNDKCDLCKADVLTNKPDVKPTPCDHVDIHYVDNKDGTHSKVCDKCTAVLETGNHIDKDEDKNCDLCEYVYPTPEPEKKYHKAYISGRGNNRLAPNANITRAEAAQIIYRVMETELKDYYTDKSTFADVSTTEWYSIAVAVCEKAGLVSGYPDGKFHPNDKITRAEFATMLSKIKTDQKEVTNPFNDIDNHWAKKYILQAYANGFFSGYGNGRFGPNNYLIRAEAVTAMNRVLGRKLDKSSIPEYTLTWVDNPAGTWYYHEVQEAATNHWYYIDEKGYEHWCDAPTESDNITNGDVDIEFDPDVLG